MNVDRCARHAAAARRIWPRFGKGDHPAVPNFGARSANASARIVGEPVLFTDDGFTRTDIAAAPSPRHPMNRIDLEGRYAVVTGGARGLGRAIGERLQSSGAGVFVWDSDTAAIEEARRDWPRGGPAGWIEVDVADPAAVDAALGETRKAADHIDILVNNAGISGPNMPTWEYAVEDWRRVIDIDLTGPFLVSRAVVPLMRGGGYGRIVNIASVAGKEGNPNAPAYSAAKAGVIALTKSLGKELAGTGVVVNCVTPAAVETRIFAQMSQVHIDYMLSKIPLARFGRPEEIAALVAWLCSEECSFSTGAVFDLSGGRATY